MLSATELSAMQATVTSSLDVPVKIQRQHQTTDSIGSVIENYADLATTTCTLAQPTAGILSNYEYLVGSLDSWQVRFPIGQDVRAGDQLVLTSHGNQLLRVEAVLSPQSYQTATRVLASVIRNQ